MPGRGCLPAGLLHPTTWRLPRLYSIRICFSQDLQAKGPHSASRRSPQKLREAQCQPAPVERSEGHLPAPFVIDTAAVRAGTWVFPPLGTKIQSDFKIPARCHTLTKGHRACPFLYQGTQRERGHNRDHETLPWEPPSTVGIATSAPWLP